MIAPLAVLPSPCAGLPAPILAVVAMRAGRGRAGWC